MANGARGVGFPGGLLFLAGCALGGPERIDPAEPYPTARGFSSPAEPGTSALRIATESYLVGIPGDSYAPKKRYYTGYTVYDEAGVRKTHVPEHGYDPARERLAPGRYLVLLDRPDHHAPVFRVPVEPDRTTDLRLEDLPPERAAPGPTPRGRVRSPPGPLAGRRSRPDALHPPKAEAVAAPSGAEGGAGTPGPPIKKN